MSDAALSYFSLANRRWGSMPWALAQRLPERCAKAGLAAVAALMLALMVLLTSACSGGQGADPLPATAAPAAATCALPALPAKPATVVDVRSWGAVPDDGLDDTAALQRALDAATAGQWLVFPAGVYQHNARLVVHTPGVVLWSEGATLHASNPDDQAVLLSADGAAIYNFTLTAVTTDRLLAPWHSRIAVVDLQPRSTPLLGNVVQGNRVINASAPGTAGANSASSAGIYVDFADGFLVAGNEVRRTLADGIHITGGARNGRVLFNTVRETGDDLIGLVSYMADGDWINNTAAALNAGLATGRERQLVRNVLVAHNDVSGNYWGRGIAVVGGADITLSNNRIAQTTLAAGILLARDASFISWGLNNVLVQDNQISQVQTTTPAYTPAGWDTTAARTGHGAVEVHSFVFDDERALTSLLDATSVQNIRIANSTITDAFAAGVRIGVGTGESELMIGTDGDGRVVSRAMAGGVVRRIDLTSLSLSGTASPALEVLAQTTSADNVFCEGLTGGGQPLTAAACGGARPVVTGAALSCNR